MGLSGSDSALRVSAVRTHGNTTIFGRVYILYTCAHLIFEVHSRRLYSTTYTHIHNIGSDRTRHRTSLPSFFVFIVQEDYPRIPTRPKRSSHFIMMISVVSHSPHSAVSVIDSRRLNYNAMHTIELRDHSRVCVYSIRRSDADAVGFRCCSAPLRIITVQFA